MESIVATDEKKRVEPLKKNVEEFFKFFDDNIKRYKASMRFAFKETLSQQDRDNLKIVQKPEIEINYIQSYLSRFLGEFSKQTPEVSVNGNGTGNNENVTSTELVEGIIREIFHQYNKSGSKNQTLKEQGGGGYSVLKLMTEYVNDSSFDQRILLRKADDPVLCFFDPMAKTPSKNDGKFCGEVYPMMSDEFKKKYPEYSQEADNLRYSKNILSNFDWAYKNMTKDVIMVCAYYCVDYTKKRLVLLADGTSMPEKEYNDQIKNNKDYIGPPPAIVKRRTIKSKKIKRYVIFGGGILEEESTELPGLPYFFVDGDSAFCYKDQTTGEVEQVIRSYIYNAIDAQKMLNYLCQSIANHAENLMMQKYIVDEKALVDEDSWIHPQKASILLKRSVDEDGEPINQPFTPVAQQDLPASIMTSFGSMQQVMQNTLGSYDAMLGINQSNLSGIAIQEGATQNNAIAMPFINSYLDTLNPIADMIVKMIPIYYKTPMTIPVMNVEGERNFVKINQINPDGTINPYFDQINYDSRELEVNVTSGYNFSIQKDKALKTILELMNVSVSFREMIEQNGLDVILDNTEIRGVDRLKQMVKAEAEKKAQTPPVPNPQQQEMAMKRQELQLKEQKMQKDSQIKQAELQVKMKQIENDYEMALINLQKEAMNDAVQNEKAQAEIKNTNIESATKLADQLIRQNEQDHRHAMDLTKMQHGRI